MTEKEEEQRKIAWVRGGGVCPICGKAILSGQPQGAHRIANKKVWRDKFGSWVIDSPENLVMVDSLGCNASVDVGSSYGKHLEVIADVLISECLKLWGISGLGLLADKITEKYKEIGSDERSPKDETEF